MHSHLHGRFRQARAPRRFDDGQPLDLHADDWQPLPRGQAVEQLREIATGLDGLHIRLGQHGERVVEGHVKDVSAGPAAERIDELVLGNRVHPGAQGLRRVERVPLVVDGQEGFLHEILHLVRQLGQPPPEERAQVPAQVPQEFVVGPSVAGESADQQGFESILTCAHAIFSDSSPVRTRLHPAAFFPAGGKSCPPV